jgi:cation diffusion facilitator family transporter
MLREILNPDAVKPETINVRLRQQYGIIGGVVGIFVNAAIFFTEIFVGIFTNSIAITADAFHNLTDVVSSVITIFSFKIASKPADKEHPFGHGRVEYLAALIVSFIVILIGYQFLQSSISKILHPSSVRFSAVSLVLILAAIPVKILLSFFNRRLGRLINSSALKATAVDALSDVFILVVASISLILASFTKMHADGFLGVVVAVFIMYSGYSIAKDALNPLLGEPPDPSIVRNVVKDLLTYQYINGVHDLVMHNYGPGKLMASIHAEVPCNVGVTKLHESIDDAEKELSHKYGILLVIHMDPLNSDDYAVRAAKEELLEAIKPIGAIQSIHDFRLVGESPKMNLIFDAVVDNLKITSEQDESDLRREINLALKSIHPDYNAIVNIDRNYLQV